jgi:acyl carrier protein
VLLISCSKNVDQIELPVLKPKDQVANISTQMSLTAGGVDISLEAIVFYVIIDKFPMISPYSLTPSTIIATDLMLDELDVKELFMEMERSFYISISDEDREHINTIGDLVNYIYRNSFGDFSGLLTDDMGRSIQEAQEEALQSSAGDYSTSVSVYSPTYQRIPFSWTVCRNTSYAWRVVSYDNIEGYKMVNGVAVMYKINHSYSSMGGLSRITLKVRSLPIPVYIAELDWKETDVSTSINSDYKSGEISVSGYVTNFGEEIEFKTQTCKVSIH